MTQASHDQQDRHECLRRQHGDGADQRRGALAAAEFVPDRIDVAEHDGRGAGHTASQSRSTRRIEADAGEVEPGSQPTASSALPTSTTITPSANTQPCVRSALVPPALPLPCVPDVDAPQASEPQAAEHRSQQVSEQRLEAEFEQRPSPARDAAILASHRAGSAALQPAGRLPPACSAPSRRPGVRWSGWAPRRNDRHCGPSRAMPALPSASRADCDIASTRLHSPACNSSTLPAKRAICPRSISSTWRPPAASSLQHPLAVRRVDRIGRDHHAAGADRQHDVGVVDRHARRRRPRGTRRAGNPVRRRVLQQREFRARRQARIRDALHVIEDDAAGAFEETALRLVMGEVQQPRDPAPVRRGNAGDDGRAGARAGDCAPASDTARPCRRHAG